MDKQTNTHEKTFRVRLTDLGITAPEARSLLLSAVGGRRGYHAQEHFSLLVRSRQADIDHVAAIQLLEDAKDQIEAIVSQAIESGYRVHVSENITIELLDEGSGKKVV